MRSVKMTKLDLLLAVLEDGEWHWGDELAAKVGWRFGATVQEARGKNHPVEREQLGSRHRYRLRKH